MIGENIAKLRKEKNLTQEELANLICVSPKTISSWEKNRNLPNVDMLISLTKVLDTNIDNILGLKDKNAEENIKSIYHKNTLKKWLLFIIVLIFTYLFFIQVQNTGITTLITKYNYNNSLTINDIEEVKNFMFEYNLQYLFLTSICCIGYFLYKKRYKYTLTILTSIITIINIIYLITTYYKGKYYQLTINIYLNTMFEIIITTIFTTVGLIQSIKLIKQTKKVKK
mgnify:CR=1 FL=1